MGCCSSSASKPVNAPTDVTASTRRDSEPHAFMVRAGAHPGHRHSRGASAASGLPSPTDDGALSTPAVDRVEEGNEEPVPIADDRVVEQPNDRNTRPPVDYHAVAQTRTNGLRAQASERWDERGSHLESSTRHFLRAIHTQGIDEDDDDSLYSPGTGVSSRRLTGHFIASPAAHDDAIAMPQRRASAVLEAPDVAAAAFEALKQPASGSSGGGDQTGAGGGGGQEDGGSQANANDADAADGAPQSNDAAGSGGGESEPAPPDDSVGVDTSAVGVEINGGDVVAGDGAGGNTDDGGNNADNDNDASDVPSTIHVGDAEEVGGNDDGGGGGGGGGANGGDGAVDEGAVQPMIVQVQPVASGGSLGSGMYL